MGAYQLFSYFCILIKLLTMNKHLEKLLILFVFLLAGLSAGAQQVVLHEDFSKIEGKGGNDKQWSGNGVGSGQLRDTDLPGWTFNKVFRADKCLKFGISGEPGFLTTPLLEALDGTATVTIRVGAWQLASETVELKLTLKGGGTISPETITYTRGEFTTHTATITGGTSESQLTIASKQETSNRFFLDLVHIENTESGPLHPLKEISSLAELHNTEHNTPVRITFSKENKGQVQAAQGDIETYVSDNTHGVLFSRFLQEDRGWHPTVGGHLAGVIEGLFVKRRGIPTIIPNAASKGNRILCLPYSDPPKPRRVEIAELGQEALRASLVDIIAEVRPESEGRFVAFNGQNTVRLVDRFHRMGDFHHPPLSGQQYRITAIVGTENNGTSNVLHPTAIHEMAGELILDAKRDNQTHLGGWAGRMANVKIQTYLPANEWSTLVLPFDVESLDEAALSDLLVVKWEGYDVDSKTLRFSSVHSIEAGVPYLVKATHDIHTIEANEVMIEVGRKEVKHEGITMRPIFDPLRYQTDATKLLVSGGNLFSAPQEAGVLPAFQAYFEWDNATPAAVQISIDGKVNTITAFSSQKLQQNSDDEITHSLSGRRVGAQPLQPGVYLTRQQRLILK